MISIEALSASGLSNKTLRRIFEAKPPEGSKKKVPVQKKPVRGETMADMGGNITTLDTLQTLPKDPSDWDVRCYLTTQIRGELQEGMTRCAAKFDLFSAMDLAYSSIPIHPLVPDLMKAAMGYISLDQCEATIAGLSAEWKDALFERDARGKPTSINQPQLLRVAHNLVHSLVTRRTAALATEVYQTFPVLEYNPFSNSPTARLSADVTTQLVEQMAGGYGYRHDYEESIRQASLYATSFKFKSKHWHTEKQTLPVMPPRDGASKAGREAKPKYERKIVKEGVEFVIPHPSRVYYDIAKPLSKLNNDLGPRWIGHWEVVPIGSVRHDDAYFNKEAILMDAEMFSMFEGSPAYFSQYYPNQISYPHRRGASAGVLALENDRVAQIGSWAQLKDETSTVLAQHYKCVIPKKVGLGSYEDPVWIRFVMAANTTVVYAEIVGSPPASVNSYNASDGLLINQSFGMQAIQWQQMMTNDLNLLLHAQYQSMVEIWALNKDEMEKEDIDKVVNQLKNPDFSHVANIVIKYSAEKLAQRGAKSAIGSDRLSRIVVESAARINEIFNSMVQTLALAERLMFFSPQELGQVSPRTVTATEMKAVRDTTLGIRDFHLIGVKQQMDADKRIIHDSYMAFGSDELEVPVAERYEPSVIEAAGFEIVDDGSGNPPDGLYTLRGKKLGLYYNYTYTTRNTDDTPPDAVVGQGIAQMYEIMSKDPVISENTNLDQRLEFLNSLMAIYAPTIAKLRVAPGQDGKKTQAGAVEQMQTQLKQMIPQIGQAFQQIAQKQAQLEAKQTETDAGIKAVLDALNQLSATVKGAATEPATRRGTVAPTIPNGAPPLRGARQPRPVPAL